MAAPPRRQGVLLRQRVKVVTHRSSSNTHRAASALPGPRRDLRLGSRMPRPRGHRRRAAPGPRWLRSGESSPV